LHELPGSAIFVDESHAALPAKLLPLAWRWIQTYADEWSCYWVLASGSLCQFWTIDELAQKNKDVSVPEIVDANLRMRLAGYENNRITYHHDLKPKNASALADWVRGFPGPRLVIVNTVQSAAVIAEYFRRKYGREHVEHLSTSLSPLHREQTLERIKARLADATDTDWTLVATSCVEAGVNLSFRTGFRELCPLVSVLQAAGRVNREGLFADTEMWVFTLVEDAMLRSNPGMKDGAEVLRGYLQQGVVIQPELSTDSIAQEIRRHGLSSTYNDLLEYEGTNCFITVEQEFKVIDHDTKTVVVDMELAERIRNHEKIDWRELQSNSVQIVYWRVDELRIQEIIEGTNLWRWNMLYDDFLGYMAGIVQLKRIAVEYPIL
jgi:CRISPR/Cas system-associated endonuclease/helicase Cas3